MKKIALACAAAALFCANSAFSEVKTGMYSGRVLRTDAGGYIPYIEAHPAAMKLKWQVKKVTPTFVIMQDSQYRYKLYRQMKLGQAVYDNRYESDTDVNGVYCHHAEYFGIQLNKANKALAILANDANCYPDGVTKETAYLVYRGTLNKKR